VANGLGSQVFSFVFAQMSSEVLLANGFDFGLRFFDEMASD
jgi:hypothetical protein